MTKLVILAVLVVIASGRPNADIENRNVATVPPNCPDGQEYINGQCRDVWRQSLYDLYNVISVSPNCPNGQQWIKGQCCDVWTLQGLEAENKNKVIVPPKCPNGQQYINGQCREIWRQNRIEPSNAVMPPSKCAVGQEYIMGHCQDIWMKRNKLEKSGLKNWLHKFLKKILNSQRNRRSPDEVKAIIQNRNIISVPNQCPNGQLPDSLGICRPVFD